jgi:hypothetical protein
MLNHIHLIIKSPDAAGFMRDFKKHTSYELMKNIKATEPNAASLFEAENSKYTIWQKTNFPKLIESTDYFWQKNSILKIIQFAKFMYQRLNIGYIHQPLCQILYLLKIFKHLGAGALRDTCSRSCKAGAGVKGLPSNNTYKKKQS